MSDKGSEAPVATIDGVPRLVGARCGSCSTHVFPRQGSCPRCGGEMASIALPTEGSVWSWTVQRIEPKPPYVSSGPYEPFALGYVDLGPLRVESPLGGRAVDAWRIDDDVKLVVDEVDDEGHAWAYRFESAEGSHS